LSSSLEKAFTRIELAAVITAVGGLILLGLPVLGNNRIRSERLNCWNNLRQIGRAFHVWAAEHENENPWMIPIAAGGLYGNNEATVTVPGVGLYPRGYADNAWFQFLWINRELGTPQILVCPSDAQRGTRVANDFSNSIGGFGHVTFQNSALSYLVGLHATKDTSYDILSADRNLRMDTGTPTSCAFVTYSNYKQLVPDPHFRGNAHGWQTNLLHRYSGNILRNDGRVEELSEAGLSNVLGSAEFDPAAVRHFLVP
jgi:hypothetical protein